MVDEPLAFREEVGDFGTLLYAGKDWLDRDLGRRSMVLTAEKVLPAVNAAIASGKKAAEQPDLLTGMRRQATPGPAFAAESMQDSQAHRLAAKRQRRASIQARSKSRIDWEGRACPKESPAVRCAACVGPQWRRAEWLSRLGPGRSGRG